MDGKEGYDPCNLFSRFLQDRREMQRLLSSLRDPQPFCTDSHCIDELSLFNQGPNSIVANEDGDQQSDGQLSTFFFIMLFAIVTMLFSITNRNLRNSTSSGNSLNEDKKPENSPFGNNPRPGDDNNGGGGEAL